jgi:hypothetical protein
VQALHLDDDGQDQKKAESRVDKTGFGRKNRQIDKHERHACRYRERDDDQRLSGIQGDIGAINLAENPWRKLLDFLPSFAEGNVHDEQRLFEGIFIMIKGKRVDKALDEARSMISKALFDVGNRIADGCIEQFSVGTHTFIPFCR